MPVAHTLRHLLLAIAERVAAVLERIAGMRNGQDARKRAGNTGERIAYFHLRRRGYTVVARQWRAPNVNGEVDLIAWHEETLCFVEVKTRKREDRFGAAYTIDDEKKNALRRMARAYVQGLPWTGEEEPSPAVRFDAVLIYLEEKPRRVELRTAFF